MKRKNFLSVLTLSLASLLLPSVASTQIVYVDANDVVCQNVNGNDIFNFDLDSDGYNDVRLRYGSLGTNSECGSPCTMRYVDWVALTSFSGQNRLNATLTTPGLGGFHLLAFDATNDTLDVNDPWGLYARIKTGCNLSLTENECFSLGFGAHKQGVRLITPVSTYRYAYIDYTLTSSSDVIVHGWWIQTTDNVAIVANSQLEYPYDGGCLVYQTVYDTVQVVETYYDTIPVYVAVTDTLYIDVPSLGMPESVMSSLKMYPNPTSDVVVVDIDNFGVLDGFSLRIVDMGGVILWQEDITQSQHTVDISDLAGAGTYIVHVVDSSGNSYISKKLILI